MNKNAINFFRERAKVLNNDLGDVCCRHFHYGPFCKYEPIFIELFKPENRHYGDRFWGQYSCIRSDSLKQQKLDQLQRAIAFELMACMIESGDLDI